MENEREDRKQRQKLLEEEAKRQEKIRKKQKEKEVCTCPLIFKTAAKFEKPVALHQPPDIHHILNIVWQGWIQHDLVGGGVLCQLW